jgi:FMN-dependent NADH-azoreductase
MQVLGISGSPRLGGNTDQLLIEFIRGAREAGANVEIVYVFEKQISGCTHCDHCIITGGECRILDDMQDIYNYFTEADIVVISSPIQFMGVSSQLKALIDRFQARWAKKYKHNKPPLDPAKPRYGYFIAAGGTQLKNLFEPARATIKALFSVLDIKYTGELLFKGVDALGSIRDVAGALESAYKMGYNAAKSSIINQHSPDNDA